MEPPSSAGRVDSLPSWFRQELPDAHAFQEMRRLLRKFSLHTVCEGARCPNKGQCWNRGQATFMVLGDICTRFCRFCAVASGTPAAVDMEEPERVARAVGELGLRYVVVTSVTRDDLPDEGAGHFAAVIREIHRLSPQTKIEVLVPDFSARRDLIKTLLSAHPDVFGHNIETVRRLSRLMRSRADHDRSLQTLALARTLSSDILIKSGLMVGLGESDAEIFVTLRELKEAGCDIVTLGQYLAPAAGGRQAAVARFVSPAMFDVYREEGLKIGFKSVTAGPLVRSSYLAEQGYAGCIAREEGLKR